MNEQGVTLHLRSKPASSQLCPGAPGDSGGAERAAGQPVELTIVEDDNPAVLTPLEWRQAIYEEKLAQARQSIESDTHIQTLRRFFDADWMKKYPTRMITLSRSVARSPAERENYVW